MKSLDERYIEFYEPKATSFYARLHELNIRQDVLDETPALFIPCYGSLYEKSHVKIAIMGKETYGWGCLSSAANDPLWGIKEFRKKGPTEWRNPFWQYFAQILGDIYGVSKEDILSPDGLFIPSIAWNNCLSIESSKSKTFCDWSYNDFVELYKIQNLASDLDISNIYDFIKIFSPNVIFFFYKNKAEYDSWKWQNEAELISTQTINDINIEEYKINQTIVFHIHHPNYLVRNHAQSDEMGRHIVDRLKYYKLYSPLPSEMWYNEVNCCNNSPEYNHFKNVIFECINKLSAENLNLIARIAIATIAVELRKMKSKMSGVIMVRLLNEIPVFRSSGWIYSEDGRGPLAAIKGAYNFYYENEEYEIADYIALSFTRKNGLYAW
ncbi:MAG: hypothetical protein NC418_07910 [Muribaculaceae bacterium]|nr:hypothetical protein [Muribaculaceae bacterium]MCM1141526.1 hypothetical protein [Muribaculum sp.]